MSENPTLYIVDGSAYIYRAFFAVRRLSNSRGMPTNALFGFMNMLRKLIEKENPDYLAITFDRFDEEDEGRSFRHELYADYKANRDTMPEDLQIQVPYFHRFVEAMNIPMLIESKVEADDVIATMTRLARAQDLDVCIVSADKDLLQLVGPSVRMIDTMRDKTFHVPEVLERFGVPPEQVRYVLALAGDTSDNVPGVPGIGEKTAAKLIAEFDDLENLLANIDKVSGTKRKENLTNFADQARLSLELVTLKEDLDIEFELEALRVSPPNLSVLSDLLMELEFNTMLKSLKQWFKQRGWLQERRQQATGQLQLLFGGDGDGFESVQGTAFDRPEKQYETVLTQEHFERVLAELEKAELYGFDLETTGLDALSAEIVGFCFAWKPDHAVYIPVAHDYDGAPEQLGRDHVLAALKPLLEAEDGKKVGQNVKYEYLVLQKYGITFAGIRYDTMLMSYLLDPGKPSHGLDNIGVLYLNYALIPYSEVAGTGKNQIPFSQVPIDRATEYAAEDADVTLMVCHVMKEELEKVNLLELHDTLELPVALVLAKMEQAGVRVDHEILETLSQDFDTRVRDFQDQINEYKSGEGNLNPNSPKQLREVLFEELALPVLKRTKSGPSTDQSVLEQLAGQHPLPQLILDYRHLAKLKSTYVDALPELIRPGTGRVHTSFNQAVAATGRLSSSNPNLQNIPIRTSEGRQIRGAFVPREGWKMLAADYSQIELRIMAHLSEDPVMLDAYQRGADIHAFTASQIFDVPLDEVTDTQRRSGKVVNFGVIYGMGSTRLATTLEITQTQAREYIDNYFARYAGIASFFEKMVAEADETTMVHTMFGRRRMIPDIHARGGRRAFAERIAANTPIQGTAADIIKMAMLTIQQELEDRDLPMKMLLQVHDELVFEVDPDFLDEGHALVVELMEGVYELKAPLKVDVGIGDNWLDAK